MNTNIPKAPAPSAQRTLLLVDDDAAARSTLQPVLAGGGYRVVTARNGIEARRVLARVPVDVVLTDVFMPEEDGLELLQHCRRDRPDMPVVVMNRFAHRTFDPLPVARCFGAAAVVQVPATARMLLATIRGVLSPMPALRCG
jgi:DNA-binding NtrC family response regulator